jgi:predicted ATPase
LLSETERVLFRRLGAFVGGCSLEAAEAVCSSSEEADAEILENLETLIDKSLLRAEEEIGGRDRRSPSILDAGDDPRVRRRAVGRIR